MELISLGVGLLVNTCLKNKAVNEAVDDFVSGSVNWIRGWFGKENKEAAISSLQENPESKEAKMEVQNALTEMMGNQQFKMEFQKWILESKKPNPTMKNVLDGVELNIAGNVNIGDKGENYKDDFDQKNLVKNSKITSGGDFTLGDS